MPRIHLPKWRALEFFLRLKRNWLVFIVGYSSAFFLGELTIVGFATQSWLLQVGALSCGIAFFLWFLLGYVSSFEQGNIAEIVRRKMETESVQNDPKAWMSLHWSILSTEKTALAFAILAMITSVGLAAAVRELMIYFYIWWLMLSCLTFAYFHRLRNFLGMQCEEIEGGSITGARAFSSLASKLLMEKKSRGLKYLKTSIRMLEMGFRSRKILLKNMSETKHAILVATETNCIPYELFASFSESIAEIQSLSETPTIFQKFVDSKELMFAKGFPEIERQHGTALWVQRLSIAAVIITAVGSLIQAIMPESLKSDVVDFLFSIFGSPSVVALVIFVALAFVFVHYFNRLSEANVRLEDLQSETREQPAPPQM